MPSKMTHRGSVSSGLIRRTCDESRLILERPCKMLLPYLPNPPRVCYSQLTRAGKRRALSETPLLAACIPCSPPAAACLPASSASYASVVCVSWLIPRFVLLPTHIINFLTQGVNLLLEFIDLPKDVEIVWLKANSIVIIKPVPTDSI